MKLPELNDETKISKWSWYEWNDATEAKLLKIKLRERASNIKWSH